MKSPRNHVSGWECNSIKIVGDDIKRIIKSDTDRFIRNILVEFRNSLVFITTYVTNKFPGHPMVNSNKQIAVAENRR